MAFEIPHCVLFGTEHTNQGKSCNLNAFQHEVVLAKSSDGPIPGHRTFLRVLIPVGWKGLPSGNKEQHAGVVDATPMQFSRVVNPVEDLQIWNASSNDFSFVISHETRNAPGLRGRPGFVASWRPIHQNRSAIRVAGSPFVTFAEAEEACEAMLAHLLWP